MSGPRVTSGYDSQQDCATPDDFMAAVQMKFGPISFDLAAHAGNKKHARYFAPTEFVTKFESPTQIPAELVPPGVSLVRKTKKGTFLYEKRVKNEDTDCYAMDAFAHDWSELSRKFGSEHSTGNALLWLNCEFSDIDPWASRCLAEMRRGASGLFLTPLNTANWYRDNIAGKMDVWELGGRLCFDGRNVYPKDCMLSHFHPGAKGRRLLWEWRKDVVHTAWKLA